MREQTKSRGENATNNAKEKHWKQQMRKDSKLKKNTEKETEQWQANKKTNMLIHKRITERWQCGTLSMRMRRTEGPDSGGVAA